MTSAPVQSVRYLSLKERLFALRESLLSGLVERDTPVRLALLAALAGEHVLFLGPPGTAKSEVARRLRDAFRGATYFERLLTRFTVPEELFGPLSIKALDDDRYHRQTAGYLPRASVAFLDEIFKANSAILNALLTLLNERQFDNGTEREDAPLVTVVAASNELAQEEGMEALYDRFLLRCFVGPVSESSFDRLLHLEPKAPPPDDSVRLSLEDLRVVREGAARVKLGGEIAKMLAELRRFLYEQKIAVSDRRWRKIVGLLKTSAFTNGRDEVSLWDCWVLQHCTWNKPEEREVIQRWYDERAGASQATDPARFLKLTETFEAKLKHDAAAEELVKDSQGHQVYEIDGRLTNSADDQQIPKRSSNGDALYRYVDRHGYRPLGDEVTRSQLEKASGNSILALDVAAFCGDPKNHVLVEATPVKKIQKKHYEPESIERRLVEVRKLRGALGAHVNGLSGRLESLAQEIDGHLWISPGFSAVARPRLEEALRSSKELLVRWRAIEDGFAALPKVEVSAQAVDPE